MSPWKLVGGAPGLAMVGLLAALGCAIPYRFGAMFVDPAILLGYSAVAFLFAANYAAQGAVGCRDLGLLRRYVVGGAVCGWVCWAVILGTSFVALFQMRPGAAGPGPLWVLALAFFTLGLAAFAAATACRVGLSTDTVKAARDLMRLALFFVLMVTVFVPRLLPAEWQAGLGKLLVGRGFFRTALGVGGVLMGLAAWLTSGLERRLEEGQLRLNLED